jgi:hypothetical protein
MYTASTLMAGGLGLMICRLMLNRKLLANA